MLQQRLLIIPKPSWTISYLQIKKAGEFGYDDTTLIKVIKIMITDHTYIARTNGLPPMQSTDLKDLKVSIDDLSTQSRAAALLILSASRFATHVVLSWLVACEPLALACIDLTGEFRDSRRFCWGCQRDLKRRG